MAATEYLIGLRIETDRPLSPAEHSLLLLEASRFEETVAASLALAAPGLDEVTVEMVGPAALRVVA